MKLPISWLREWVDVDADAEQVADAAIAAKVGFVPTCRAT